MEGPNATTHDADSGRDATRKTGRPLVSHKTIGEPAPRSELEYRCATEM